MKADCLAVAARDHVEAIDEQVRVHGCAYCPGPDGVPRQVVAGLPVGPHILSQRLAALSDGGVLDKRPYREAGSRSRMAYHLTPAGRQLVVVFGALQQWGDLHCPHPEGPLVGRGSKTSGRALRVVFVDDDGREVPLDDVDLGTPAAGASARPVA
jgi:hypothetical protein